MVGVIDNLANAIGAALEPPKSELAEATDLLNAMTGFLKEANQSGSQGSQSAEGGPSGGGGQDADVSGEFSVWGDPHVQGDMTVDGKDVSFNFITEGGNGEVVNLLDTDKLDIEGKFDTLNRSDGNTYVTEETVTAGRSEIAFDANDDQVTLNGREIEDGTYHSNGNTITKSGDTVTIETADGQKITITDKGDYLDTSVELDGLQSSQMGGMVGDAAMGKANQNAEDYAKSEKVEQQPAPQQEQGPDWAAGLLKMFAGFIGMSNPALGGLMTALANMIEQSGLSQDISAAVAA